MGSVYLAMQLSTGRKRALKILQAHWVMDPRMRERFALEARAASSLQTDHVVDVVAAGIDEASDMPWLAMEYLEGETLHARVHNSGRLSPPEVAEILQQLCHGLALAHQAGLVHRDLKPANIFVADPRREGVPFTVKLLDFGIAKLAQDVQGNGNTSAPIGSPGWMAPEQFENQAATPATDIWAFGLVTFYCLVGSSYWQAREALPALLREILASQYPAASERARRHGVALPSGFDQWFARCTARDPAQRFVTVQNALDALLPVLSQAPAPLPEAAGNVTWGTLPVSVPAVGDPTRPTQPPTYPSSFRPPDTAAPNETWPATASGGTLSPLADPTASPPSRTGSGRWVVAGGAAFALLTLAAIAGVGIAGGLFYYRPWEGAAVASPSPTTTASAAPRAPVPSATAAATASAGNAKPAVAKVPNGTTTSKPPTPAPATAPGASATPSATAAPAAGPTPAAAAGYRGLVLNCWANNEGASATQGASLSVTVRIDGNGSVRGTQVSGADAYPHTRFCIVTQSSSYRGFKPATFSQTTIGVALPAAKK